MYRDILNLNLQHFQFFAGDMAHDTFRGGGFDPGSPGKAEQEVARRSREPQQTAANDFSSKSAL